MLNWLHADYRKSRQFNLYGKVEDLASDQNKLNETYNNNNNSELNDANFAETTKTIGKAEFQANSDGHLSSNEEKLLSSSLHKKKQQNKRVSKRNNNNAQVLFE